MVQSDHLITLGSNQTNQISTVKPKPNKNSRTILLLTSAINITPYFPLIQKDTYNSQSRMKPQQLLIYL